ncbi:hypothetical protein ACNQR7_02760 [Mycolicibacterium senegalense]|uniref:hypothetical protein n=1 Tax=Mycolicibacterium senegalense TaxID=1796 RepID=UPI003AAB1B9D
MSELSRADASIQPAVSSQTCSSGGRADGVESSILERAEAALEAVEAIGGPNWEVAGDDPRNPGCKVIADYDPEGAGLIGGVGHVVAPFVAAARTLVPELLAEVERLRKQVRQMRRQTELFMEDGDRNRLTVALAVSDE